ncbi:insulinase family protein [Patescibacteria group bacterium]|nr:insulinase family protein [Patescibacteria group bacterium]
MKSKNNLRIKKTVFKNGLRLLTIPQKNTRTVTVLVLVKTGSRNEHQGNRGVSHFLEHMFFKGTKRLPTSLDVVEPLDKIGGQYNAFTGEEYTGYFAKVDADHTNLALEWVADIFLNSQLPAKEIQKEKGVVIEELNMHKDIPMSRVDVLWHELLYGDQPAGWDIVGTKKSILGLSRKDLQEYVKDQYVASNTLVCVAGNMQAKQIEEQVRKLFSGISSAKTKEMEKAVERQTKPEVLLEYRKTDQTHIAFGARGYNLFAKERHSQRLLSMILGGMMSSRLWIEIREKLGLAYYVSTQSSFETDIGYIITKAGIKNDSVEKAVQIIAREYKKIAQTNVSRDELQKVKDYIKGSMALELESSDDKAFFYGMQELLQKEVFTLDDIYDKIEKVSIEDIRKAASDILRPENLNLVVLGPFKDKAKFSKLLIS